MSKEDVTTVGHQTLFTSLTEFRVKYAGLIPEIPFEADPTCRTEVLRILDKGKKDGHIPKRVDSAQDAVLALNAYSIRITAADTKETLLQAPIHMLAAVSYVNEDEANILGIKIGEVGGNKEITDLAVVYCESSKSAEDICQVFGHCFQLIFCEAATQYFDKKIDEGGNSKIGYMWASGSTASPCPTTGGPTFLTGSVCDQSDRTSAYAVDLIQEYLRMLHALLSAEELKQFAVLLKRWRGGDNLPLSEFCQKVLELYGSDRKYLLARMRPFIPDAETTYFDMFLEQSGISDNAECSLPSWSPSGSFEGVSAGKPADISDTISMDIVHKKSASPNSAKKAFLSDEQQQLQRNPSIKK